MGRMIDVDEVKKKYPLMENDFGMVINERLHKELDKIPTVEAIPKADYDTRLKADLKSILDKIRAEIENEADTSNRLQGISEIGLRKALKIIDKYKAESEEKE